MRAAIITSSDSGYAGKREDVSGPVIAEMVREAGYEVVWQKVLPVGGAHITLDLTYGLEKPFDMCEKIKRGYTFNAPKNTQIEVQGENGQMESFSGEQVSMIIDARVDEMLELVNLKGYGKRWIDQLSGGQQQRVAIARALALHPDILCFDEPTSALDPELTGEVLRVLRDLAEHKTTMIIVTHEMKFARDVADRILFMDGGVVVEQGDAKQVIDHPQEERTRKFLASYGK